MFDEIYTAPHMGFRNSDDYYQKASALPYIKHIQVPALIIHAQDDPFIPFHPLGLPDVTANPNVIVLGPETGGHVGFVSADPTQRYWAEARAVEFIRLVSQSAEV